MLVPSGGHTTGDGLVGFSCIEHLEFNFIERASVAGLDTHCVASIHRGGFSLQPPPPQATRLDTTAAEPFLGHYADSETKTEADVKFENGRLRLVLEGGGSRALVAVNNSAFRFWGSPTHVVHFLTNGGTVTGLTLTRGAVKGLNLRRVPIQPKQST